MDLRVLCSAIVFLSPIYAAVFNSNLCSKNEEVVLAYGDLHLFTSSNYPDSSYNSNSSCSWRFTGPTGSRILVTFQDFQTERCCDKLKLGEGHDQSVKTSLIINLGGEITANRAFSSAGSRLWMNFTSDGENNLRGYSLEVAAFPAEQIVSCPDGRGAVHEDNVCYCNTPPEDANCVCGEDEFQCYNGRCIPQSSVCNDFKDCSSAQAEDEINCHSECPMETSGYLNYGERRVISSANYPNRYSNGLHCRWLLTGPDDALIVIKFDDSELDRTDYLFIGNGVNPADKNSTIRTFSGVIRQGIQYASSGPEMWMTFHTDRSFSSTGFQVSVKAERVDEVFQCFNGSGVVTLENVCDLEVNCETGADEFLCDCEAGQFQCYNRRCIDGAKQCDNHRDCNAGEDEINCHQKCPQDTEVFFVDYGSSHRINSADYPDEYPPNLHCRWLFESPQGSLLIVKVVEFNVDDGGSDKLIIGSGSQATDNSTINAELTGQVMPGIQYASSTNDAWITFVTDRTRSGPGWTLELSAAREDEVYVCFQGSGVVTLDNVCDFEVNCETEYDEILCDCSDDDFTCYNDRCIQAEKKCNGEIDCNQGEDEINCHSSCPTSGDPAILEYGYSVTIISDGYPDNYGNNINCRWLFKGPPDSVIVVKLNDFQLDLQGDKVIVGDGLYPGNSSSVRRELTGVQYAGRQESSISPELWMTFFSNSRRNSRGFAATVFARPEAEVFKCFDDSGVVTVDDVCDSTINCATAVDEYLCDCDESQFTCYDSRCLDQSRVCDNRVDCEQGEDEINCHGQCPSDDKVILAYDDIHEIMSANFPMDYENNMYCRWRFQGPDDSVVIVRVMEFDLNRYGDRLVIGSGNYSGDLSRLMIELTDTIRTGVQFASDEPELWMTFFSNFHGTAKGFRLEVFAKPNTEVFVCFDQSGVLTQHNICDEIANCISEADELPCECRSDQFMCRNGRCISDEYRCDDNFDCAGGEDEANCHEDCPTNANVTLAFDVPTVLQSANHPGTYSSNTHCLWLLIGPADSFLKIKIREFELESLRDTLRIGYGLDPGKSGTVIEILTGSIQRDMTILVTNSHAWMTFITDETVNLAGFNLEVVASRTIDPGATLN